MVHTGNGDRSSLAVELLFTLLLHVGVFPRRGVSKGLLLSFYAPRARSSGARTQASFFLAEVGPLTVVVLAGDRKPVD